MAALTVSGRLVDGCANRAMRDTVVSTGGGADGKSPFFVKKGALVFIVLNELGKDHAVWGLDAAIFRPERWLEQERPKWSFLAFGAYMVNWLFRRR